MKNRMINRLSKLALISVAFPIMGAQTQAIAAPPAAAEAPQPLFVTVRPPVGKSDTLSYRYYINPRIDTGANLKEGQRKVVREAQSRARAAGAIDGSFVLYSVKHGRSGDKYITFWVWYAYNVPG
jgi:hypothetical protein